MTESHERFRGIGVALVTPFAADGSVDFDRYEAHVERMIAGGVTWLVPCGTTGESATMRPEEQADVIRSAVNAAAGRVPVMAGAGANATDSAAALARAARAAGADAVMSVAPYYNKPPQEGLFRHFEAVAAAAELPVIVYNVPGRTASNILPATTLRLAELDGVIGVKEASGDLAQIATILRERPDDFLVLSGDDELTLPIVSLGGDGVISVAANQDPAGMSALTRAALDGDFDAARRHHYRLLELMRVNFLETNPIPVKTALELLGHGPTHFRLPQVPMTDEGRDRLRSTLDALGLTGGVS